MSFFAKVNFGNDCDFDDASNIAEALRDAGYDVTENPKNGQLYFVDGGDEE